jgi:chaperonin cofactor prefoldin
MICDFNFLFENIFIAAFNKVPVFCQERYSEFLTMTSPGKHLVPAALATGVIFAVFTTPLVLFSAQPIDIQLRGERVFEGKLKDVAAPYCGFAGFISLGAGLLSLAVTGWRQSTREAEEYEQQLAEIERQLKQKELLLEEALLSKDYLEQSGLSAFLDGALSETTPVPASTPVNPVRTQPVETAVTEPANVEAIAQIQNLHVQLQQILAQIEGLQTELQVQERPAANSAMSPDAGTNLAELTQRLKALDPSWTMQQITP